MNDSKPDESHMSEKTLEDVIGFIRKANVKQLIFSGGEPTEHPRFAYFINHVIESVNPRIVFIASNGMFVDDKQKTDEIRALLKDKRITGLQITNVAKYYPRHDIIDKIKALEFYDRAYIATSLIDMIMLGRALKSHRNEHSFRGPSCANFYLLSRQGIVDFFKMIQVLEENSHSAFCKPMVDPDGYVHVGENLDCTKLGHVTEIDPVAVEKRLLSTRPCNTCGAYPHLSYLIRSIIEFK
jgi:hypothetical protein